MRREVASPSFHQPATAPPPASAAERLPHFVFHPYDVWSILGLVSFVPPIPYGNHSFLTPVPRRQHFFFRQKRHVVPPQAMKRVKKTAAEANISSNRVADKYERA